MPQLQQDSALVTVPLSDQLMRILSERIVNLFYPLGAKIDIEKIKEEYGVSHIPIRDALHKLAEQGLVVVVPRIGYFTANFSPEEIDDLCEVRELVEMYSIGRSIGKIDRNVLESHLQQHLHWKGLTAVSESDARDFFELGEMLHRNLIVGNAGSPLVQKTYLELQNKIRMASRRQYLPPASQDDSVEIPPEDTDEHIEIINSLIDENRGRAKKTLKAHLRAVRKRMLCPSRHE